MNITVQSLKKVSIQINTFSLFMFFKLLIFLLIISTIIDFILRLKPRSKLVLIPINYILNRSKSREEIVCEFEIRNFSKNKETMIPKLNINCEFIDQGILENQYIKKEIILDDGTSQRIINNYWQTIIIKAGSSIKIKFILTIKKFFKKDSFIWLKVNWQNYGHFGLINKENYFLLNNYQNRKKTREIKNIFINKGINALAIKTNILGAFDNPIQTITKYCEDIVKEGDILVVGETPLAIMQGRYENPLNIKYSFISKILCYFFHPTSSLATACGMQLLISKIGFTRILFSLIIGFFFKLIGVKGIFYRLTGAESSLIDDISGTTIPYDKTIVLGPKNPKKFCDEITKILKVESAVVDVNDLGGVKILASSNKSINKELMSFLKSNPAGNDDQKTPIVLIRKKYF